MQQMPDIGKIDSKAEVFCLKLAINNGGKKGLSFKADIDKLNFVTYRYRNSFYLKDNELYRKPDNLAKLIY